MKLKYFLLAFISIAVAFGFKNGDPQPKKPRPSILEYKTELGLTEVQVSQIQELQNAAKMKVRSSRQKPGFTKDSARSIMYETQQAIVNILTPEQAAQWKAIRKSLKQSQGDSALRSDIYKYKQAHIMPVMREKRMAFNKELSEAERECIADLRARKMAIKQYLKTDGDQTEFRKSLYSFKKESASVLDQIIKQHKTALDAIELEIEPLQTKWKADMDSIGKAHGKAPKGRADKENHHKNWYYHFLMMGE